jgi:hypothetical protein
MEPTVSLVSAIAAATLIAQTAAVSLKAPEGFDVRKAGIQAGRVERIEYDSKVTGNKRPAGVYLPPGYSAARKYPVLYLLHGIGGNENHWTQFGKTDSILDNLIADNKAVPMIVVMPNGRASNEPSTMFAAPAEATGELLARRPRLAKDNLLRAPAGSAQVAVSHAAVAAGATGGAGMALSSRDAAFEKELIGDHLPFIESRYWCRRIVSIGRSSAGMWAADGR